MFFIQWPRADEGAVWTCPPYTRDPPGCDGGRVVLPYEVQPWFLGQFFLNITLNIDLISASTLFWITNVIQVSFHCALLIYGVSDLYLEEYSAQNPEFTETYHIDIVRLNCTSFGTCTKSDFVHNIFKQNHALTVWVYKWLKCYPSLKFPPEILCIFLLLC